MTINKEQPVSDAVETLQDELDFYDNNRAAGGLFDPDAVRTVLAAMQAASHPLEQQQAVSGDTADQIDEAMRAFHYEAFRAGVCYGRDEWPQSDEEWADLDRGIQSEAVGEHYEGWSDETIGKLTAALTASGMGTWQPIETAPKDATRILIAMPRENGAVCEAWWATEYEGGPGYWSTPPSCTGRGYTILADYPTHWMPLPEPPRTALQEDPLDASRDRE